MIKNDCKGCKQNIWVYEGNGLCIKCYKKSYYQTHKEHVKQKTKTWYKNNKEYCLRWHQKYYLNNSHIYIERVYKKLGIMQIRSWDNDKEKIKAIYKQARQLGLSVDHIVPLQGKNVCGLHVSWNLQLIPLADNVAKGNKYA